MAAKIVADWVWKYLISIAMLKKIVADSLKNFKLFSNVEKKQVWKFLFFVSFRAKKAR